MATDGPWYGHDLGQFVAKASDDEVKADLELRCVYCDAHICDIEHGDTLAVLARTVEDHECPDDGEEEEQDG